jgi:hypothetical protein
MTIKLKGKPTQEQTTGLATYELKIEEFAPEFGQAKLLLRGA